MSARVPTSPSLARRRARHLLAFAIAGTLLWALRPLLPADATRRPTVLVSVPSGAGAAAIDQAIEEAVLVAAALQHDLPWTDPFVRARLLADVRASDPTLVAASDAELLQHARRLDLVRRHPIVRARVAEAMRRRLEHGAAIDPPSEAELAAYLRAHPERYTSPPRIDLRQVFVSARRRGASLDDEAAHVGARLRDGDLEAADGLGDPSLVPRDQSAATPASLDAALGPGIGEAIAMAEPGRWTGPLRGAYGIHFVFVRAHRPGRVPPLTEIERRVRADLVADRRRVALARRVQALRARVQVTVRPEEAS